MDDTTVTTPPQSTINAGAGAGVGVVESSSRVNLVIKSSNQQYEDVNIESDLCMTVQGLKKHLSLVYPGKPDINDQKLIYSGKLLDDSQKLSEVIRSYKDVYQQHHIFHLVCANKNQPLPTVKRAVRKKETTPEPPNELRHRPVAGQAAYQQPHSNRSPASNAWEQIFGQQSQIDYRGADLLPANSQMTMQQQALLYNAWIQQIYAQYMQEYMQRSASSQNADGGVGSLPHLPHPLLQPQPVSLEAQPLVAQAVPNEARAAVQPQPQRQAEVANFPNIQEEPEMRDWLDSFFSFTRLAIFITVLYFNSSPMRCLLVVLIAGVIYLYHIGVLRRRRERNNNNINRNNNAGDEAAAFAAVQQIQRMMDAVERNPGDAEQQANDEAVAAPAAAAEDAAAAAPTATPTSENAAAVAAEAAVVEQPNANNSVIAVVRTFVVTFFTSLLPEAPAL